MLLIHIKGSQKSPPMEFPDFFLALSFYEEVSGTCQTVSLYWKGWAYYHQDGVSYTGMRGRGWCAIDKSRFRSPFHPIHAMYIMYELSLTGFTNRDTRSVNCLVLTKKANQTVAIDRHKVTLQAMKWSHKSSISDSVVEIRTHVTM